MADTVDNLNPSVYGEYARRIQTLEEEDAQLIQSATPIGMRVETIVSTPTLTGLDKLVAQGETQRAFSQFSAPPGQPDPRLFQRQLSPRFDFEKKDMQEVRIQEFGEQTKQAVTNQGLADWEVKQKHAQIDAEMATLRKGLDTLEKLSNIITSCYCMTMEYHRG